MTLTGRVHQIAPMLTTPQKRIIELNSFAYFFRFANIQTRNKSSFFFTLCYQICSKLSIETQKKKTTGQYKNG